TSWQFGRKARPLPLYGPSGIKQLAEAMMQFFAYDIHIRRDLVERHPATGATIDTHIVREGVVYDDGGVRVTAFKEEHPPGEDAAFRQHAGKAFHGPIIVGSDLKTITINGDINESHH